jgi:hypothetical protein
MTSRIPNIHAGLVQTGGGPPQKCKEWLGCFLEIVNIHADLVQSGWVDCIYGYIHKSGLGLGGICFCIPVSLSPVSLDALSF